MRDSHVSFGGSAFWASGQGVRQGLASVLMLLSFEWTELREVDLEVSGCGSSPLDPRHVRL